MPEASSILALVTDAFGGRGGIAQYNRDLLAALAKAGSDKTETQSITILPRHAPDQLDPPDGVQQMRPLSGRLLYTLRALAVALSRRVDIVFCGHLYMCPLAVLIARMKRARLIVQTHGIEAWSPPSRLQRAALEKADLVLCVSRYTRSRVLDWAAIEPERVVVLPNTVRECFVPGDGSALRATWGLAGKRVLLTVGRLDARERYKGHDRVIEALPHLVAAGHDVVYVILGDGDDMSRLQSLVRAKGLEDRARFMGAARPKILVDAYRLSDLFIMPSTGEGFGIAFLEAMASGTPALGLAAGGARDALGDGELGIAVVEDEVAPKILAALNSKANACNLASAVRARFGLENFRAGALGAIDRLQDCA